MKLKELRKKADLSQSQLADITGLNVRTIQHYEQGSKVLDHARLDTLLKLCLALKCNLDDLIENDEMKTLLREIKELPN